MKNLILISTLLAAGTLAANATTTLNYADVGNFFMYYEWRDDNQIVLSGDSSNKFFGFYTFETSKLDFNNLEFAKFNIYLHDEIDFSMGGDFDLKVWAVERENTDLSADIAKGIIDSVDQSSGFVSTLITTDQTKSMLSIDITSVLQKITKGNDVAILLYGKTRGGTSCALDWGQGDPTTLSVEFFAVPEPSMFGLVAGTLALVLAGTRRRRK